MPDNVQNNETAIRKQANISNKNKIQANSRAEAQPQTPPSESAIPYDQPSLSSGAAGINTGRRPQTNLLEFSPSNLMQGILYSEILGKPKSLRRRRW